MLAVAGAWEGSFYLFSGVSLAAGADGKAVRTYLRDAFCFSPSRGWEKLPEMPRAAAAAPSPALAAKGGLTIFSGDDGKLVNHQPVRTHPGFPQQSLSYDVSKKTWVTGSAPFSRATASTASWRGLYVVPNGEVRPRVRTPEVWSLMPQS
jgi:N-acetylneuraminic acid mutarotase